jgi:hypothetical protein
VFGVRAAIETIRAGKEIDRLLVQRELGSSNTMAELMQVAREANVPVQRVPTEKLDRITRKNHQGVIAFVSAIRYVSLHNVLSGVYEKGQTPLLLILDRVTDVRNFGAIARTAECAGVHAIVIPAKGAAQINADAVKTSSGALNFIPVCRENSLRETGNVLAGERRTGGRLHREGRKKHLPGRLLRPHGHHHGLGGRRHFRRPHPQGRRAGEDSHDGQHCLAQRFGGGRRRGVRSGAAALKRLTDGPAYGGPGPG